MNSIEATVRTTKTQGEINTLRKKGNVPGIIYGGKDQNQKVSVSTKEVKMLLEKENFLSNVLAIKLDGKNQNVLPREVKYDTITDEPIHVDFLRVVEGTKIILDIPVNFINNDKSPGLKRGGVLNIVRRKVELKCPTENIPTELVIDLDGVDIGDSFKISSIKLPDNVVPTIQGRDFVIATLAAPTVIKEPEKPAEETAEGAEGAEGSTEGAEGETKVSAEGGDKKEGDKDKKDSDKKEPEKKEASKEKK
tara:strand:- start:1134 stop:1883 length:750 start_codon:yes stop_codon:yes gene_type:complete